MATKKLKESTKLVKPFTKHRATNNITQEDVSENMELLSPQFISNYERQQCFPSPKMFKKITKAYRIDEQVAFDQYMKAANEKASQQFWGTKRKNTKKAS